MNREEFLISRIPGIYEKASCGTMEEANTLKGFIFPVESQKISVAGLTE